jgi:hypothetical protein
MMVYYLLATVVVFGICFLAYCSRPAKYADLMGVCVLLALASTISNLLVALYGFPDALLGFPVLDLFLAAMIYRAWAKNREVWKIIMVASFVAQLMLHVVTVAMWKTGGLTQHGLWTYVVVINGFFIVQLLTLASVGVGHGLDTLRRWMSDRRCLHPVPDARR